VAATQLSRDFVVCMANAVLPPRSGRWLVQLQIAKKGDEWWFGVTQKSDMYESYHSNRRRMNCWSYYGGRSSWGWGNADLEDGCIGAWHEPIDIGEAPKVGGQLYGGGDVIHLLIDRGQESDRVSCFKNYQLQFGEARVLPALLAEQNLLLWTSLDSTNDQCQISAMRA